MGLVVFALSYATAYAETLTIAHVRGRGPGGGRTGGWAAPRHWPCP